MNQINKICIHKLFDKFIYTTYKSSKCLNIFFPKMDLSFLLCTLVSYHYYILYLINSDNIFG